jgi:hypothetical protein
MVCARVGLTGTLRGRAGLRESRHKAGERSNACQGRAVRIVSGQDAAQAARLTPSMLPHPACNIGRGGIAGH